MSGFYILQLWISVSGLLSAEDADTDASPDESTTPVYNTTAPYFDSTVESVEYWQGIIKLRRKLTRQVFGDVLEVAVGTGRNCQFYDFKNCNSVTMIDESGPMLAIARAKWAELRRLPEWREDAPEAARRISFRQMSATEDVPLPAAVARSDRDGFNCILSTFSLCSLPHPADVLTHWCRLLVPPPSSEDSERQPRVLLLEHGCSHYDWLNRLLDKSAPAHAKEHGCWWNKDIGAIAEKAAEQAGMEIVSLKRRHFGTTWVIEMRQKRGLWQQKKRLAESVVDVGRVSGQKEEPQTSKSRWWPWHW